MVRVAPALCGARVESKLRTGRCEPGAAVSFGAERRLQAHRLRHCRCLHPCRKLSRLPRQFPPRPVCHARHPRTARQSDRLRQSRLPQGQLLCCHLVRHGYRMKLTPCRCARVGQMVFRAEPTVKRIQVQRETQATDRGAWPTSRVEQLVVLAAVGVARVTIRRNQSKPPTRLGRRCHRRSVTNNTYSADSSPVKLGGRHGGSASQITKKLRISGWSASVTHHRRRRCGTQCWLAQCYWLHQQQL